MRATRLGARAKEKEKVRQGGRAAPRKRIHPQNQNTCLLFSSMAHALLARSAKRGGTSVLRAGGGGAALLTQVR